MQGSILAKKALEIDKVKIYRYVQGHPSHVSKDKLEVLYLPEFDTFLLQQKNFKYVLAPNAPILATLFEKKAFRSYILTDLNGYYLVKLKTAPPPPVLKNFETILCNYSQLAYKSGQEELKKDQGKESKKKLSWTEKISKAGAALQRGGEIFRDKVVDAATAATRKNGLKENNPNHLSEKTIEELKDLDNKVNLVVEVPHNEVVQLFSLSKEIEAMTVSQIERGKRAPDRKGTQGQHWQEFGKGAAGSAQSIWKGMEEAASIIYEAIKKKKSGKQGGDLSYQERPTEKTDNGDQQGPYSRSQSDYSPILPNSNNSSFQSFDLVQSLEMKGRPHSDQNKLLQDITIDLAESVIKPQSEYRPQTNNNPMPMYEPCEYIKPAPQTNQVPQNTVPMYQSSDYMVPAPQMNQVPQNSVPMYEPCDYKAPAPQINEASQNSVPMYESSDYKVPAPQANEVLQDKVLMYESSDYKKPVPKNNEVADMKSESQADAKSNVESASSASFGLTESVTEYPQAENQPQLKQSLQDAVPMYESSDFIRKVPQNTTQSISPAGKDEQFTGFKRGESRDIDLAPQYKPQNDENMPLNNQQYPGFDMVESMDMKLAPKSMSQDKQQPQVQVDNTGLGVIPFAESGVYVRPSDSQGNQADSTGLGKIPFAESTIFMGPSHSAVNK